MYIRKLPGPSPRLPLGFYHHLLWDLQDLERQIYQKPIRKKRKNAFILHMEENDGKQRKMTENSAKKLRFGAGAGKMEESGGKMTENTPVGGKWRKAEESGGHVEEK